MRPPLCIPLAVAALASPALSQVEHRISLVPPLPNLQQFPAVSPQLDNFRLTLGDLDGNGVPDAVFTNGVAFARVYFGEYDPTTSDLIFPNYSDVLAYPASCASTGDGARQLSTSRYSLDTPLIHDIDLDGLNELIYLEHIQSQTSQGEVRLAVYDYDGQTGQMVKQQLTFAGSGTHDLTTMLNGSIYWAPSCNTVKSDNNSPAVFMKLANLRGRVSPQDLLVWTGNHKNSEGLWVYTYEGTSLSTTGIGQATVTRAFKHDTTAVVTGQPEQIRGTRGHTWQARDLDRDGYEEVIGRHVLGYDPAAGKTVRWGVVTSAEGQYVGTQDNHIDGLQVLDFLATYVEEGSGDLVPSPGLEVLAAPDLADQNPVGTDPSGPYIYRANHGHDLFPVNPSDPRRPWPRKILNQFVASASGTGQYYWFPSDAVEEWLQPSDLVAGDPSAWDVLGDILDDGTGTPNTYDVYLDVQGLLVNDFVVDPSGPNGSDVRPGFEMLCTSKFTGGLPNSPGCGTGYLSYLFDNSPSLAAIGWADASTTTPGVSIYSTDAIDWAGSRSPVEARTWIGPFCSGPSSLDVVTWQAAAGHPRYSPVDLYSRAEGTDEFIATLDNNLGYDINPTETGWDSREELVFWRLTNKVNDVWRRSELVVVTGPPAVRTEPSPLEYRAYRRVRSVQGPYKEHVDYASLDGVRFDTSVLSAGVAHQPYGVLQDQNLVRSFPADQQRAAAILAEGGTAPYTFQVVGGALPLGLQTTTKDTWALQDAFWIYGTPIEGGTSRFRVQVTDALGAQATQEFWLHVEGAPPPTFTLANQAPRITTVGFAGTYVDASTAASVPIEAWVFDAGGVGDVSTVEAFDPGGSLLASLSHVGAGKWTGTLDLSSLSVGEATHVRVVATDAAGRTSLPAPYLAVDGGPGGDEPLFADSHDSLGQTPVTTPTIDRVEILPHSVIPGEVAKPDDDPGRAAVKVHVGNAQSLDIVEVEVLIRNHASASRSYSAVLVPSNPQAGFFTVVVDDLPNEEISYGTHSINVRLKGEDAFQNEFYSDWWPQLLRH